MSKAPMARFTIILPESVKAQLKADAEQQASAPSTLIARYIQEYYSGQTSLAEYQEQLTAMQQECSALQSEVQREREKAAHNAAIHDKVVKDLQTELETEKRSTKSLEIDNVNKAGKIMLLEQNLVAAQETIGQLELGTQELIKQAEQERTSKETVTTGLQHELELTKTRMESLSNELMIYKGQVQSLERDKEQLQKQLELVTLRLPAPKEGFWSRVFGRKKEQEVGG